MTDDPHIPLILTLGSLGVVAYIAWINDMNMCQNFTLDELTSTSTGVANVPPPEAVGNLVFLCRNVLQPLRNQIGRMQITSGYRSPEANIVLLSQGYEVADNSQHMYGQAVDFVPLDVDYQTAWAAVENMINQGAPIDQAGNYAPASGHIHLSSIGAIGNRGEVYYAS